jgi:acyl-coenzyme A synthetase/AMP-(fatty) acid ligase
VYFEPLPKTSTGKIQKHVLRALARQRDQATAADAAAAPRPPE